MTETLIEVADHDVRAAQARSMAVPPDRAEHSCFRVLITAACDLTSHMRRLTLAAPELRSYATMGPDEYFGLIMPQPGRVLGELPSSGIANIRAEIAAMPDAVRPDLRWYTVRAHRPVLGEVDVDVMVHGDAGPGSAWVRRASAGDVAGFQTGTACYHSGLQRGRHLIVGDETAVPAMSAMLEQQLDGVVMQVVVEVPDRSWVPTLPAGRDAEVLVVERGTGAVGSAALPAVRALVPQAPDFAWICGEQTAVKHLRRHVVRDLGLDRSRVYHCAYWILGRPRP